MVSRCWVILVWTESNLERNPSGDESPKRPARIGSQLSSPTRAEGNSPDSPATGWLGPGAGGTCIALEGPGAESGPWGAESATRVKGLSLALSLGPAVEDLLTEPTLSTCGVLLPSNLESKLLSLSKTDAKVPASNTMEGGGGAPPAEAVEFQQYYQYSEYYLNYHQYPPTVNQRGKITTGMDTWDSMDTLLAESSAIGGDLALALAFPFATHF